MTVAFFTLPLEVRQQIYGYVFAGAQAVFEFDNQLFQKPPSRARRNSFIVSSEGNLGFLRASKQCYTDAIESYHNARTVHIRRLSKEYLGDFTAMGHIHDTARTVELHDFHITDFSTMPSFPRLQRLVWNGLKMWGGNMVVQEGQSALDAFNEGNVLDCLFENARYCSLGIHEQVSRYFPTADIVINFRIGNQVLDKNMMRGIQNWYWACSYHVKTGALEKRLANRLVLW